MPKETELRFDAQLIAHKLGSPGQALRIAGDSGRIVNGDSSDGQRTTQSVRAPRREGESNREEVCRILMEKLNEERTRAEQKAWTNAKEFKERDSDIDALIYNETEELAVQVTRPVFGDLWPRISRGETVITSHGVQEAAAEIKHAVEQKQLTAAKPTSPNLLDQVRRKREQRTGRPSRLEGLVLAVDCIETPSLVLSPEVVTYFDEVHGAWARNTAFTAIWLVGATSALTRRLK